MSESIFCSTCGTKLQEGVKFCSNCGAKAETVAEPAPTESAMVKTDPPPEEIATEETPPAATPEITQEHLNKSIVFMVLSIIIPIFGWVMALIRYTKENKQEAKFFALWGLEGFLCGIIIGLGDIAGIVIGLIMLVLAIVDSINRLRTGKISITPNF
ncbi:MAG: zinc-ribbon domain-containing protein [Candidatus Heimdallarchaeaceae archaeon]|jgi:uncharacterized Zn finger protein (UPF0148 family)